MRNKGATRKDSHNSPDLSFVSEHARPLVEDTTLYEFDSNFNEMISKCLILARKHLNEDITESDFNSELANILHVYILPSVKFKESDMFSLKNAISLLDERIESAEKQISSASQSLDKLNNCFVTLKENILSREKCDSEKYLDSCDRHFLIELLKTIEDDVKELNISLAVEQSKVNWEKSQEANETVLVEKRKKRDEIFDQVKKYVFIREALKNVIERPREPRRSRKKKRQVANSFHNVFLELKDRVKVEEKSLASAANVKVNIIGARESAVSIVRDLDNNNRDSITSFFDLADSGCFNINGESVKDELGKWLPIGERVNRLINCAGSKMASIHKNSCDELKRKIDVALSEYKLFSTNKNTETNNEESGLDKTRKSNSFPLAVRRKSTGKISCSNEDIQLQPMEPGAGHSTSDDIPGISVEHQIASSVGGSWDIISMANLPQDIAPDGTVVCRLERSRGRLETRVIFVFYLVEFYCYMV